MATGTANKSNLLKIESLPIDVLVPYIRNARTHSDEQVAQIAASIKEFGFTNPVLIDQDGGIIAGHGRVMAARKLSLEAVPCIRLSHLTPTQRRAYILADNKLALNSGWDMDMLKIEFDELEAYGFDLELTGFSLDEISAFTIDEIGMPELPSGDKEPFQQITFTLHDDQAEQVREAMDIARGMGEFVDSPNENGNGNALARVCELFITQNGNS